MYSRDRYANVALFAAALGTWAATAWLLTSRSPRDDVGVQLAGAVLLGLALTLSLAPLMWLASFAARRRIARRGDWARAARRAGWVGLVAALFVILRGQGALGLPIAAFVVAIVLMAELTLSRQG